MRPFGKPYLGCLGRRSANLLHGPQPLISLVAGCLLLAENLSAQTWRVVNLHPGGATSSRLTSTDGTSQGGEADGRAGLWTGTAASFLDLHPAGADVSFVLGIGGGQQVGYAAFGGSLVAIVWQGTAASFVDLHPAGEVSSFAYATDGSTQAGYFNTIAGSVAALWSGSSGSVQNLNPAGYGASQIMAAGGGQQGGRAVIGGVMHAGIWEGTPESFVDLNPAGATESLVSAADGATQAGYAIFSAITHAGLWKGSAASFVDLHPAGVHTSSTVNAVGGRHQAGYTVVGEKFHAAFWSGTAASHVDLHSFLPAGYSSSTADGIWTSGPFIEVVGSAYNDVEMRDEAILWKIDLRANRPAVTVGGKKRLVTRKSAMRIRGTARDPDGDLARVEVKVGPQPYRKAQGPPARWHYRVRLKPKLNRVAVRAADARGAFSNVVRLSITRR